MLHKTLKSAAWLVGAVVGLAVVVYLAAIATNWRDEPPSADSLRLASLYESRPPVADADNAFVYLLGFEAPLGMDPRTVGARRLAWLQGSDGAPFDRAADPQATKLTYTSGHPAIQQFLTVCGNDSRDCAAAFSDSDAVFEQWTAAHPWLLDRYLELIAYGGWREHIPGIAGPWADYAPALAGQLLLLLQTKRLAAQDDAEGVAALLGSDARFWRMVLRSSDSVLTTMIATAALRRGFEWGNLAVRSLPAGRGAAAVPSEWLTPMTAEELSLRSALVGEWVFVLGSLRDLGRADFATEQSLGARASALLTRQLLQPQATLNRRSAYLTALIATLDAPLLGFAAAADAASSLAERTAAERSLRSLYNAAGQVWLAGPADYAPYARRVADVEGMRRAALATVTLRDAGIPAPDMAAALAASPLRNPYDDQPLRWDANAEAVVFVGLEPGERGEHRFFY